MSLFGGGTIKGNRITDFAQTTATVGVVIPFGYGKFPADGNVTFADLPPKESVTTKKQGKGGIKQETYNYSLSYAVAFCKGPIYGYLWIKRNGKVVYTTDPNAPAEDKAYAQKWLQKATLYYGTMEQLPDSTIEAAKGTGKVSAFRGLAYIVVEEDDVTEGGGAVPTYEAAVVATPPEVYMTSRPYAIEALDDLSNDMSASVAKLLTQPTVGDSFLSTNVEPLAINLYGGQKIYTGLNEDRLQTSMAPVEINLYGGQKIYVGPNEDRLQTSMMAMEIDLYGGAQTYIVPPENLQTAVQPISIVLE